MIRKYKKTQGSNKNDVGKMPKEPDPSFKLEARIGKARNTHMMVVHIFNHVRVSETPRDRWQDKSQHFICDFTSIGPKVKQEKMGIKINPGYFGNKSQNVFSNPTEQTIIIRAWKK